MGKHEDSCQCVRCRIPSWHRTPVAQPCQCSDTEAHAANRQHVPAAQPEQPCDCKPNMSGYTIHEPGCPDVIDTALGMGRIEAACPTAAGKTTTPTPTEGDEWLVWFREAHPTVVDDIERAERARIERLIEKWPYPIDRTALLAAIRGGDDA